MEKVIYLVDYLVKQIVKYPERVSVELGVDEENFSAININVDEKDMGSIIGKAGNVANAIRTIAQATAYANGEKKVKVNINSI